MSALTGGAVIRAALRIYFGVGGVPSGPRPREETRGREEETEVGGLLKRVPITMLAPIALLLVGALGLGVVPGVAQAFGGAADRFIDRSGYVSQTLAVPIGAFGPSAAQAHGGWTTSGVVLGMVSSVLAVAFALAAVHRARLPGLVVSFSRGARPVLGCLRAAHSGHVGDYVTWLFVGVATLCLFVVVPIVLAGWPAPAVLGAFRSGAGGCTC